MNSLISSQRTSTTMNDMNSYSFIRALSRHSSAMLPHDNLGSESYRSGSNQPGMMYETHQVMQRHEMSTEVQMFEK